MHRIAVYGTLKRGNGNYNYLLKGKSKFLGQFKTNPQFTMYSLGGFPAVVPKGNTSITVEVFEVDDHVKASVDSLEGYSGTRNSPHNWYDTISLDTPWGESEMYIFKSTPPAPVIESGCF